MLNTGTLYHISNRIRDADQKEECMVADMPVLASINDKECR